MSTYVVRRSSALLCCSNLVKTSRPVGLFKVPAPSFLTLHWTSALDQKPRRRETRGWKVVYIFFNFYFQERKGIFCFGDYFQSNLHQLVKQILKKQKNNESLCAVYMWNYSPKIINTGEVEAHFASTSLW